MSARYDSIVLRWTSEQGLPHETVVTIDDQDSPLIQAFFQAWHEQIATKQLANDTQPLDIS